MIEQPQATQQTKYADVTFALFLIIGLCLMPVLWLSAAIQGRRR